MKLHSNALIKKKFNRGLAFLLTAILLLSTFSAPAIKANAASPILDSSFLKLSRVMFMRPNDPTSPTQYKASSTSEHNEHYIEFSHPGFGEEYNNLVQTLIQSGGTEIRYRTEIWTGTVLWNWAKYLVGWRAIRGDGSLHSMDFSMMADSRVDVTEPVPGMSVYESRGWKVFHGYSYLPIDTDLSTLTVSVRQPENGTYGVNYGNRNQLDVKASPLQNYPHSPVLLLPNNIWTIVREAPTASTIISGQILSSSTLSNGLVVSATANNNVGTGLGKIPPSKLMGITGSYSWTNPGVAVTKTTSAQVQFAPQFGNFRQPANVAITVPVRAAVITLNADGGSGGSSRVDGWHGEMPASIMVPTRPGFEFKGFYSASSGGTQYYNASGAPVRSWNIPADTTLYAQWEATSVSSISAPPAITTGSTLTLTAPAVQGTFTSQGWQYSANGSSDWTVFNPTTRVFTASENQYYLRYFAAAASEILYSNSVRITVNKHTPALSISATPTAAAYPTNVVLTAALTSADTLLGKEIAFFEGDQHLGTSLTNASGQAEFTVVHPGASVYYYRAVFPEDANHTSASSSVLNFTVSKGTQSAVSFEDTRDIAKTYGDVAFPLPMVSGGSGEGTYSYRSSNTAVATVSGNTVTLRGAGEASIYVKKLGDANYNDSSEAMITVKVAPKPVTIQGMQAHDKTYDGTAVAFINSANAVIDGVISADAVFIDATNATATFSDSNVAIDKTVTFAGFALSGLAKNNYTLSAEPESVVATITPKTVTVGGIAVLDKAYDGNTSADLTFANVSFSGKLSGDALSVTATGIFRSKNVQSAPIPVDISEIVLGGASANNYVLSVLGQQAFATARITPATLTVTPTSGQFKYYGQSDPVLTYLATSAMQEEAPAFSGSLSRASGDGIAADYAIGLGTLAPRSKDAFLASNYQLALAADAVRFEIKEYTTEALATATPNGRNGWFASAPVLLAAPEGYQISTSNALIGNVWGDHISLDSTDGANKSVGYYLLETAGTHAGAISSEKTFSYHVDRTPPIAIQATYGSNPLAKFLNTATFGLFFKETVTVTLEATDATSGIEAFQVSFDGVPSKSDLIVNESEGTYRFQIAPQFVGNFTVTAMDKAGNESTETSFEYMAVDTTPPTAPQVTATSKGSAHASGNWSVENIEITLSGSAADSGIAKYQYSINNSETWMDLTATEATAATAATPYHVTKASAVISASENATYTFRAVSNSGVTSSRQDFIVQLDKATPEIEVDATNSGDWTNKNVVFELGNAAPQISGTTYQVKIGDASYQDVVALGDAWDAAAGTLTISTDTSTTYRFKATSGAGLSRESDAYDVKIDKTSPVIGTPTGMPEHWVTTQETITFTVTENGSGIDSVTVKNGEETIIPVEGLTESGQTTYTFVTTGNGTYTIDAADNVSNQAVRQTMTIAWIDTDLPVIAADAVSFDGMNTGTLAQIGHFLTFGNFFKEGIKVTIPAADATSGLDRLYYTFKDADGAILLPEAQVGFTSGNASVPMHFDQVKDHKDMTMEVYATDIAGNKAAALTLKGTKGSTTWTFENTLPVIGSFKVSGNDIYEGQWFTDSSVTVTSEITDDTGIYKVHYRIDGEEDYTELAEGLGMAGESAPSYVFSKVVTGEGAHGVELLVTDNAMNTSTKRIDFYVDSIAPSIENVTGNASTWQNTDVTLTVTASDAGSGLAVDAYSFDGGVTWQPEHTKVYGENQTIAADTIQVRDAAGNVQSYGSEIVISRIDKDSPKSSEVQLNGTAPSTDWYTEVPFIEIAVPVPAPETAPETTYFKLWNTSEEVDNTEPKSGTVLTEQPRMDADGIWKLKTWTTDEAGNASPPSTLTILVDTTSPEGDIEIESNSVKAFLNKVTFGLFFNHSVDVKVTATDETSGIAKVEYYRSMDVLDPEDVEALTAWTAYTGVIAETAVDAARFIYYVKITDHAGNGTYFASEGATFDTTDPFIAGIFDGAVYYVDQAVIVTDRNLDTITVSGSPFESGDVLAGDREATYAVVATDKAGNTTTVTVTMKPIESLAASIALLSNDNVTSSGKAAIEEVLHHVEAVLLSTENGATKAQIDALHGLLEMCATLLDRIQEVQDEMEDANAKTRGITVENGKSSDEADLEDALSTIHELLASNNLTEDERAALEQMKTEVNDVLATIREVADNIAEANAKTNGITLDNVKSSHEDDLEEALVLIHGLLASNNLTDSERRALEEKKTEVSDALAKIAEVAGKIADAKDQTNGITTENVNSTDKSNLEEALAVIEDLLASNNLAEDERAALEQMKTETEEALKKIAEVEEALLKAYDPENAKTVDNVAKEDRPALEKALEELQNILDTAGENLTEEEVQEIEDLLSSIHELLQVLDQVAEVEDAIEALPEASAVGKEDVDAITKAKELYEALTEHQKAMVNAGLKAKLEEVAQALYTPFLYDAATGTKLEGIDGTIFDIRTALVVLPVTHTLDEATLRAFALGVQHRAPGQKIVELYDIKLLLEGKEIQPEGMVQVTLALPDGVDRYSKLQIAYIAEDGSATIVPSTISGNEIAFITNHFSYYAIIGTPVEDSSENPIPLPKTGEGNSAFPLLAFAFLSAALLLMTDKKNRVGEARK